MPEKLENILKKEVAIEDIKKMKPLDRFKYYSSDWVFNIVWWPGWIGGPLGTFANTYFTKNNCGEISNYGLNSILNSVLVPFLSGAMIASALKTGYDIARDYNKIKKIKE